MAMKLVHALMVVLTALLFLVRQKYLCAGVPPTKRRPMCPACGDTPLSRPARPCKDYFVCTRSLLMPPKYKRDPDITIDNEDIGQHPHDY